MQCLGRCRVCGRCHVWAAAISGLLLVFWVYPSLLLMNLQSGNMRDTPYYTVAWDMLQLPADPISAVSWFAWLLINPVADFDRQGGVGLPCWSESPAKQPWHLLQGCQPSSLHGWGWEAGTARHHITHICDFEEEDGMRYDIIWMEIVKHSTQIIVPWREHGRSCQFSELGCIKVEWTLLFSWFCYPYAWFHMNAIPTTDVCRSRRCCHCRLPCPTLPHWSLIWLLTFSIVNNKPEYQNCIYLIVIHVIHIMRAFYGLPRTHIIRYNVYVLYTILLGTV